jgi:DNA-binding MarR family transcriptional regulator
MDSMSDSTRAKVFDMFAKIFLLNNRLQYIIDKELQKDQLTTKQFLLIAAVEKAFDDPPSLKEAAYVLGTSHQNVKQIANQLQGKGFIEFEKDPDDRRVTRLKVTDKNRRFWDSRAGEHEEVVLGLFGFLSDGEIAALHSTVNKMLSGFEEIYNRYR